MAVAVDHVPVGSNRCAARWPPHDATISAVIKRRRVICLGLTLTLLWTFASAQTVTGRIEGVVTDPSGAPVPNASIEVIQNGTNVRWTTAEFPNAWIKDKLGLRQFRLRGVAKVRVELRCRLA